MFNSLIFIAFLCREQPPSGGCVLKLLLVLLIVLKLIAATFGWLCVETKSRCKTVLKMVAATFGWLCVETSSKWRGNTLT